MRHRDHPVEVTTDPSGVGYGALRQKQAATSSSDRGKIGMPPVDLEPENTHIVVNACLNAPDAEYRRNSFKPDCANRFLFRHSSPIIFASTF